MKNITSIIFLLLMIGMTSSMQAQTKNKDKFTVQVDGLGCAFCAYGLEKKFVELKGIGEVTIDLETGVMNFVYPAEKDLSIARVQKQVEKAGYTPVSVDVERADGSMETTKQEQQVVTDIEDFDTFQFFVAGNCNMCKRRIEDAAKKIDGIESAEWNKETQRLLVKVSADVPQLDIQTAIAKSGHDTEIIKAEQTEYEALPACCQYDRVSSKN